MVTDMGQLMRKDAAQFVVIKDPHDARRHRDGGMRRIAPGSKSVRHVRIDDTYLRHRKPRLFCQLFHQTVKLGRLIPRDGLRPVHL